MFSGYSESSLKYIFDSSAAELLKNATDLEGGINAQG